MSSGKRPVVFIQEWNQFDVTTSADDASPQQSLDQEGEEYSSKHPKTERKINTPIQKASRGPYRRTRGRACCFCGTTETPEWRRGPNREISLCNACGLNYRRDQQKRKREETSGTHPNTHASFIPPSEVPTQPPPPEMPSPLPVLPPIASLLRSPRAPDEPNPGVMQPPPGWFDQSFDLEGEAVLYRLMISPEQRCPSSSTALTEDTHALSLTAT